MQADKTQSPDVLTVEFYQHFLINISFLLGPLLLKVYLDCVQIKTPPESCITCYITLILKGRQNTTKKSQTDFTTEYRL